MKRTIKIVCCLVAALLFLYLMIWDYPSLKKRLDPIVYSAELSEETNGDKGSAEAAGNLEKDNEAGTQDEQEESTHAQSTEQEEQPAAAACEVHLYFDQIFESAYEQLYPVMKEKGYTGTLVLVDGQLPGDRLQMTEDQCREMLDNGWELAIGGSEEIDMSGNTEEVAVKWGTYLKQYLKDIKTRMNVVPTTYCFNEGEYREEFDPILKELGFTTIRYYGDQELEAEKDGLTRIRGYRINQEVEIDDVLEDLNGYSAVALSTRRVADDIKTPSEDIEIGRFKKLLDSLGSDPRKKV
ncbi:MAG: polysaccharide deacetylase family protein [Lachnospiraceae bacterium]|nr:polysaccharide deacetylase family protein [Lachnospiraceae bacterium]